MQQMELLAEELKFVNGALDALCFEYLLAWIDQMARFLNEGRSS